MTTRTRALGLAALAAAAALALGACGSPSEDASGRTTPPLTAKQCQRYLPEAVEAPVTARELGLEQWTQVPEAVYASALATSTSMGDRINSEYVTNRFLKLPDMYADNPTQYKVSEDCGRFLKLDMLRAWTTPPVPTIAFYTAVPADAGVNTSRPTDPLVLVELKIDDQKSVFVRGEQVRPEALHQPRAFTEALYAATRGLRTGDVKPVDIPSWGSMLVVILQTS